MQFNQFFDFIQGLAVFNLHFFFWLFLNIALLAWKHLFIECNVISRACPYVLAYCSFDLLPWTAV